MSDTIDKHPVHLTAPPSPSGLPIPPDRAVVVALPMQIPPFLCNRVCHRQTIYTTASHGHPSLCQAAEPLLDAQWSFPLPLLDRRLFLFLVSGRDPGSPLQWPRQLNPELTVASSCVHPLWPLIGEWRLVCGGTGSWRRRGVEAQGWRIMGNVGGPSPSPAVVSPDRSCPLHRCDCAHPWLTTAGSKNSRPALLLLRDMPGADGTGRPAIARPMGLRQRLAPSSAFSIQPSAYCLLPTAYSACLRYCGVRTGTL